MTNQKIAHSGFRLLEENAEGVNAATKILRMSTSWMVLCTSPSPTIQNNLDKGTCLVAKKVGDEAYL